MKTIKVSAAQIRAARALVRWSARELSSRSGVSQSTIHRAESTEGLLNLHQRSLIAIKQAFEQLGVEFLDHTGVKFKAEVANRLQDVWCRPSTEPASNDESANSPRTKTKEDVYG
jgi:transcriptional regulator with XRE-family HTH domain